MDDLDIPQSIEDAAAGKKSDGPEITKEAIKKMHASVVLKGMQGDLGIEHGGTTAMGDVERGSLHAGKRSQEGLKANVEQLKLKNVEVQRLQHLLSVRNVSLPKVSLSMMLPGEPTKVTLSIDNNVISGVQLDSTSGKP